MDSMLYEFVSNIFILDIRKLCEVNKSSLTINKIDIVIRFIIYINYIQKQNSHYN